MKTNEIIIEYRHKRNLSQSDVAARSKINLKYYQAIERGERAQRLATLYKIACAIDIPFDLLFRDSCKEFLIYSILGCLDKYADSELSEIYQTIGMYLDG